MTDAPCFFPDMRYFKDGKMAELKNKLVFNQDGTGGYWTGTYVQSHVREALSAVYEVSNKEAQSVVINLHTENGWDDFYDHYNTYANIVFWCYIKDSDGNIVLTSSKYFDGENVTGDDTSVAIDISSKDLTAYDGLTMQLKLMVSSNASRAAEKTANMMNIMTQDVSYTLSGDGSGVISIMPLDYAVVYNNRVVGVRNSEVRASALGNFYDFSTFVDEDGNPDATGAYATNVGSDGRFTGIAAYNNVLLLFKRNIVYQMYGSMPYTMTEISNTGCIDHDSICEIDGVLYWASNKGIVKFTGGTPAVISYPAGIALTDVCKSGTDGRRYYCYNGERIYVYDTWYGLWHIEDSPAVKQFYTEGDGLYMLCDDGIYLLGSGTERVAWEFETKDYTFDVKERKNLSKLWARVFMERNSRLEVYVRSDGGAYSRVAHYQADRDSMFDFKVRVKKCDSFTLKFKGEGDVRLLDLHGRVTVSSSKHRSGQNLSVFRR